MYKKKESQGKRVETLLNRKNEKIRLREFKK